MKRPRRGFTNEFKRVKSSAWDWLSALCTMAAKRRGSDDDRPRIIWKVPDGRSHRASALHRYGVVRGVAAPEAALRQIVDDMLRERSEGRRPSPVVLPDLDPDERERVRLDRLRRQAIRAATQTPYYAEVFEQAGVDAERLGWDDFTCLPITTKAELRDRSADFVAVDANPQYRSFTGGTTGGRPIGLWWSEREFNLSLLRDAIEALPDPSFEWDLVLDIGDSTQFLSLHYAARLAAIFGDAVIWGRMFDPDATVAQLAEYHRFGGQSVRPRQVAVFASYWGQVVEAARRQGRTANDFAFRSLNVSGEIATEGLLRRSREVFGEIAYTGSGYGASELWGTGGARSCETGHMHFGSGGHFELLDPDTWEPAAPGGVATLVATVLPPFRETMPLIRYDTEDLFRVLDHGPTCGWPGLAAGTILGKRSLSVRHRDGSWTCPRAVLEALEDVDDVPLPARCGFWAEGNGVVVEVVVPGATAAARGAIGASLERWGVPVQALYLRDTRDALTRPYPLRCDSR